jgi:hypothetical protein
MKTKILAIALLSVAFLPTACNSQLKLPKLPKITGSSGVTEAEAGQGIKEALTQGVTNAVLNLNKTDGFFGSEIYKMLLPPGRKKDRKHVAQRGNGC